MVKGGEENKVSQQNPYYDKLFQMVCVENKIEPDLKISYGGYYLTVVDYLKAVSVRDQEKRIILSLRTISGNQMSMVAYLQGAVARIISETINQNPDYFKFYKGKIKKVS